MALIIECPFTGHKLKYTWESQSYSHCATSPLLALSLQELNDIESANNSENYLLFCGYLYKLAQAGLVHWQCKLHVNDFSEVFFIVNLSRIQTLTNWIYINNLQNSAVLPRLRIDSNFSQEIITNWLEACFRSKESFRSVIENSEDKTLNKLLEYGFTETVAENFEEHYKKISGGKSSGRNRRESQGIAQYLISVLNPIKSRFKPQTVELVQAVVKTPNNYNVQALILAKNFIIYTLPETTQTEYQIKDKILHRLHKVLASKMSLAEILGADIGGSSDLIDSESWENTKKEIVDTYKINYHGKEYWNSLAEIPEDFKSIVDGKKPTANSSKLNLTIPKEKPKAEDYEEDWRFQSALRLWENSQNSQN